MSHAHIRPPEEWVTGRAPMTSAQTKELRRLAEHMEINIPFCEKGFSDPTQVVTKAEASRLITRLRAGGRPTEAEIDGLGRNPVPYEPPPHPTEWANPYKGASDAQKDWLLQIISTMGIPREAIQQTLEWLTVGHASLLIGRLKEYKDSHWMACRYEDRMILFEHALEYIRKELPPEEEDAVKLEEGAADSEEVVKQEDATLTVTIPKEEPESRAVVKTEA